MLRLDFIVFPKVWTQIKLYRGLAKTYFDRKWLKISRERPTSMVASNRSSYQREKPPKIYFQACLFCALHKDSSSF